MSPIDLKADDPLTITLWDFSWFVRTGPGEPFEDLDRAFRQAAERGYNTIRICAMPFLLFGSGLDTSELELGPLGGRYAQRVRWYDVGATTVIDGRALLLDLLRGAARHRFRVIVSSWEYQQSPAFATDRAWSDALLAVDPEHRAERLADSLADLVDFARANGVADTIAFVELHNEVQFGHLTDGLGDDLSPDQRVVGLKPRLQRGIDQFKQRHPDVPVTVNYAGVPVGAFRGVPDGIDVFVVHPYVYGVLNAFTDEFGLRRPVGEFPQDAAAEAFLIPGAPPVAQWQQSQIAPWKSIATIIQQSEIYAHDWGDADKIDRWLYEHYGEYRVAMADKLTLWLDAAADLAAQRGIPLVFGEGWVGYTPLEGSFEEGPVGAEFCRLAAREAARVGAWGSIVCSNAAPQHPMWADIELQLECNALFTQSSTATLTSTVESTPPKSAPVQVPERTS
ncbi:MAG: cellulase-like family protein [Microbacteriaceae bacterium]